MRKHRIAECLLVEIIGMPWEDVHAEACRWEHVMSDAVELRVLEILGSPTVSPFGNPIPGLHDLLPDFDVTEAAAGAAKPLSVIAGPELVQVTVRRLDEPIQDDAETMTQLRRVGVLPGALVQVHRSSGGIWIGRAGEYTELTDDLAVHVLVDAATLND